MFKENVEKIIQEKLCKELCFEYKSKLGLIEDICTALSERLDERHKGLLEELCHTYDSLIELSDNLIFSYTYEYINSTWRELVLHISEEWYGD